MQDYIVNIKSFQKYLSHIVSSVENDRYHEETIKRLSDLITLYYKNINEGENSDQEENADVEFIDDNSQISIKTNSTASDTNSDTEDSDSESDSDYSSLFLASQKITPIQPPERVSDKYLTEFSNGTINNKELHLYKKSNLYQEKLDLFIKSAGVY